MGPSSSTQSPLRSWRPHGHPSLRSLASPLPNRPASPGSVRVPESVPSKLNNVKAIRSRKLTLGRYNRKLLPLKSP